MEIPYLNMLMIRNIRNPTLVTTLIGRGANDYENGLSAAISRNCAESIDIVKVLIDPEKGFKVAVRHNHLELMAYFYANITTITPSSTTKSIPSNSKSAYSRDINDKEGLLISIASCENSDFVNANMEELSLDGKIKCAIKCNDTERFDNLMLQNPPNLSDYLCVACMGTNPYFVNALLNAGATVTPDCYKKLLKTQNIDILTLLLNHNPA